MPTARVVEVLEGMEDQRIVALDGNRVRFTHPLFATGVYTNATASRRRAMHRKLAALVERPEERARHLALAATTGDPDTLAALDAAADATVAQGAPAVAAELVNLAMKLGGDTVPRRLRAGELNFRAGALVAARTHVQSALDDAPPGILRCLALMWLGGVAAYGEDMVGAVEAMSAAVEEAGDDPYWDWLCLPRLAMALAMAGRLDEALQRAEKAVELAARHGVAGLESQALSIWVLAKFAAGQGVDHGALRRAVELQDPTTARPPLIGRAPSRRLISAYTGDLDRARDQMTAERQRMLDEGTEVDIIWVTVRLAAIAVWSGRYVEAALAAQEAVERAEQMGGRFILTTAWARQAAAAAYTGREVDARRAAQAAIDAAHEIGATRMVMEPTISLAFLEVSLGNYAAALVALQPFLDAFDGTRGTEIEGSGYLPDAIEALTNLDRADDAARSSRPSSATENATIDPGCWRWARVGGATCSLREAISKVHNAQSNPRRCITNGCRCRSKPPAPNSSWANCSAVVVADKMPRHRCVRRWQRSSCSAHPVGDAGSRRTRPPGQSTRGRTRADRERAARRRTGRNGVVQQTDCRATVHRREDGRDESQPGVSETGHSIAIGAFGRAALEGCLTVTRLRRP